ncbi:hypothetical protein SEA_TYPHA_91 [Mycobacterium phage Typha]|uniref:Uncharacterized protein n=1 Tax=Mycobacterium phage Typha TaxID=2517971 RepID=A0A482JDM6_9CAUD|nr:hypothetical protein KCH40_gp078 [Mycobacterium phage Typha]QBP29746.1 hypothetical protein SEA_TYPHA_91 [Mycobacterium phage Typha]
MRPNRIHYVRDGQVTPVELTPMTDPPDDGLEHWVSSTDLLKGDQLRIEQLTKDTAIHFQGCIIVYANGAVFMTGQKGSIDIIGGSDQ